MKSIFIATILALTFSAAAQEVPSIPYQGTVEALCYNGVPFTAVGFYGNEDVYEEAIDYALTGKIVSSEKYNDYIFAYIELENDVIAVWFLHNDDRNLTHLFFYNESELEGVD